MATLNKTVGWINAVIFTLIALYMVLSCLRKHRLTKFQWFGLSLLQFCILIVSVGQVVFNNIETSNCNFILSVIYTVEVTILFFISMLIGFKTYQVCREINDFALHGNLPSQQSKRCKTITIVTIWIVTLVYMAVDLTLSFYWEFDTQHENRSLLDKFGYINHWIQIVLFLIVTVVYFFAALLIRDL